MGELSIAGSGPVKYLRPPLPPNVGDDLLARVEALEAEHWRFLRLDSGRFVAAKFGPQGELPTERAHRQAAASLEDLVERITSIQRGVKSWLTNSQTTRSSRR